MIAARSGTAKCACVAFATAFHPAMWAPSSAILEGFSAPSFGLAPWNYLLRSSIKQSRTMYAQEGRKGDSGSSMSPEEMEEGAASLCKALSGHCMDTRGNRKDGRGA